MLGSCHVSCVFIFIFLSYIQLSYLRSLRGMSVCVTFMSKFEWKCPVALSCIFCLTAITCCPHLALNVNNKDIHDQPSHFYILEGILKCMWKSTFMEEQLNRKKTQVLFLYLGYFLIHILKVYKLYLNLCSMYPVL